LFSEQQLGQRRRRDIVSYVLKLCYQSHDEFSILGILQLLINDCIIRAYISNVDGNT
jgi:hypothetical protein